MALNDKFDPEVMQAKWVLGGINPADMPDLAIQALEQGFTGSGLQQLAGLVKPTQADLDNLPARAFADMGLKALDKDQGGNTSAFTRHTSCKSYNSHVGQCLSAIQLSLERAHRLLGRRAGRLLQ